MNRSIQTCIFFFLLLAFSAAGQDSGVFPSLQPSSVTVYDIDRGLPIQQHLTGINLITNPYLLVAADVNRSNAVSTLDATILNQCLLGNPAGAGTSGM